MVYPGKSRVAPGAVWIGWERRRDLSKDIAIAPDEKRRKNKEDVPTPNDAKIKGRIKLTGAGRELDIDCLCGWR